MTKSNYLSWSFNLAKVRAAGKGFRVYPRNHIITGTIQITITLLTTSRLSRRMYAALCKVKDSSELVHAICKGEEPSEGIC